MGQKNWCLFGCTSFLANSHAGWLEHSCTGQSTVFAVPLENLPYLSSERRHWAEHMQMEKRALLALILFADLKPLLWLFSKSSIPGFPKIFSMCKYSTQHPPLGTQEILLILSNFTKKLHLHWMERRQDLKNRCRRKHVWGMFPLSTSCCILEQLSSKVSHVGWKGRT